MRLKTTSRAGIGVANKTYPTISDDVISKIRFSYKLRFCRTAYKLMGDYFYDKITVDNQWTNCPFSYAASITSWRCYSFCELVNFFIFLCVSFKCKILPKTSSTSMRFLVSPEDMEEHFLPSGRLVLNPGNPSRIHSIEAILGFKDENAFHQSFSNNGATRPTKDSERRRNCNKMPTQRKEHGNESFESEWCMFHSVDYWHQLIAVTGYFMLVYIPH